MTKPTMKARARRKATLAAATAAALEREAFDRGRDAGITQGRETTERRLARNSVAAATALLENIARLPDSIVLGAMVVEPERRVMNQIVVSLGDFRAIVRLAREAT